MECVACSNSVIPIFNRLINVRCSIQSRTNSRAYIRIVTNILPTMSIRLCGLLCSYSIGDNIILEYALIISSSTILNASSMLITPNDELTIELISSLYAFQCTGHLLRTSSKCYFTFSLLCFRT